MMMKLLLVIVVAVIAADVAQAQNPGPTPAVTEVDDLLTYADHSVCGCCYPPCCCRCIEVVEYMTVCNDKVDICWIVDGSGSISGSDFDLVRSYIIDVGQCYNIGPDGVLMGVVQFGFNSSLMWGLNDDETLSNAAFEDAVNNMPHLKGMTNTVEGVERAIDECFNSDYDRPNVPNLAIVLTDGRITFRRNEIQAIGQRLSDITNGNTFVVGITQSVARGELIALAGGNPSNVFEPSEFEELKEYVSSAIMQMCDETEESEQAESIKRQCVCCCPSPYGFGEGCGCTEEVP